MGLHPLYACILQESGDIDSLDNLMDPFFSDPIHPGLSHSGTSNTGHDVSSPEPLFPEIPEKLLPPIVNYVPHDPIGANTSMDYEHGPGVNLERNRRVTSYSIRDKEETLCETLRHQRRFNSTPEMTCDKGMEMSSVRHFHDDENYRVPVFPSERMAARFPLVGRKDSGSRSRPFKTKKSESEKPRSLSPNHRFFGRGIGKPKLSALRGKYPAHVRGVEGPSEYDSDKYSGVVNVEFHGRLNPLDAIGTNVAKSFPKNGGGSEILPGRVVGQVHMKGRLTGVKYRVVYLNGTEESLTEEMFRYHAGVFSSACMRTENPLKPVIVRMM